MVTVLLIPDGAAGPGRDTALARAATPHLDALVEAQGVGCLEVTPGGSRPGTEVGVAALLGLVQRAPLGRGWLEAAALDLHVPDGAAVWRCDLTDGVALPPGAFADEVASHLPGARIHRLDERRHLLVGPHAWGDGAVGHDAEVPQDWRARTHEVADAVGCRLQVWGRAARPRLSPCPWLAIRPDSAVVHGLARLLDATLLDRDEAVPDAVLAGRHTTVVWHDGGPDQAGHDRDDAGKVAAVERFDAEVVAPTVVAAGRSSARVVVAPDHGCDPATGAHTAAPVPASWPGAPGRGRLTEAAVAHLSSQPPAATWEGGVAPTVLFEEVLT